MPATRGRALPAASNGVRFGKHRSSSPDQAAPRGSNLVPCHPLTQANRPIPLLASRSELFSGAFTTFPALSRELKEFKLYLPTSAAPSVKTF